MAHASLEQLEHRPWALPSAPWTWRQSWLDLLFAHWPVDAGLLQRFVPAPLKVQEFDGASWIGLVPFRMAGVMRRPFPDLPWISAFPELNVRLYVEHEGKAGVWFLSLDATNPLAVWAAKRYFHLPYFHAQIGMRNSGNGVHYKSQRKGMESLFEAAYRPTSSPYQSKAGTLEHWLTERYCLYAQAPDGTVWRNDVHHVPWPLQAAEAEIAQNTYLSSHGLSIDGPPRLLHFARRIDVVVWNATRAA
jgi:uncharacterized protein YqjF (DUF2071 family)